MAAQEVRNLLKTEVSQCPMQDAVLSIVSFFTLDLEKRFPN
jgi:hypothetical protein